MKNLITDLRAFMFSTYAQERHTKGHALALIKRLEEITNNYNHHE